MNSLSNIFRHEFGITYLEILIAITLIAIALVPMMNSLQTGLQGTALHKTKVEVLHVLTGHLEQILTEPFEDLDAAATDAGDETTPTTYSDAAAAIPYNVFISRYDVDDADGDGDVFTGGEEDLLWVRIALLDESESFQALFYRN